MRLGLPLLALCLVLPGAAAGGRAAPLLPDLVQNPPSTLVVTKVRERGAKRFRLGFLSSFVNAGAGPLEIVGGRSSRAQPTMRADQALGVSTVRRGVGLLRYVHAETHQHWHLLPFDRYELRSDDGRVLRARKSGFCLSDQFRSGSERDPLFPHECGRRQPGLLSVREGLSSGWGDYYVPTLEGQYFDVTDLPDGEYVLVNTLNPGRRLLESDYGNDSASIRLRLASRRATIVRVCRGTSSCPGR